MDTVSIPQSLTLGMRSGIVQRMTDEKVRENRVRRVAERRGYRLTRSRRRDPLAFDFGGYMLVETFRNVVVLGGEPHAFAASLDDVETYLEGGAKSVTKTAKRSARTPRKA